MSSILQRLKLLLPSRRRAAEREMREELNSLAEIAGRRELGNLTLAAENAREEWSWGWLERLGQDLRYALRTMRKDRGITALAVLSIAAGIGLTAGVFSVEDAIFLRPPDVKAPSQMFQMRSLNSDGGRMLYSWPDYEDMARAGESLCETVAYTRRAAVLVWRDNRELAMTDAVTPNYFSALGVHAALGRTSLVDAGGRSSVVLGNRIWRRVFGGDSQIVGKAVLVNGSAFYVAGVMPTEFIGLNRGVAADLWIAADAWFDLLGNRSERLNRNSRLFEAVARLKPEANPAAVAGRLDAAIRGAGKNKAAPRGANGTSLRRLTLDWREKVFLAGGSFLILGLVLFVACANVVQLRLAQAEAQGRELSMRVALGATAWRIVRLRLFESGSVALAAGALGILIARGVIAKATEFVTAGQPFFDFGIRLDLRVLVFAAVATLLAALITGLAPARRSLRLAVAEALKAEQGSSTGRTTWVKRALLVAQVGVGVAFFGIAVLAVMSLRSASSAVRPGMDPRERLLILSVTRSARPYPLWAEQASARLAALPGVRGATFARRMPLSVSGGGVTMQVEIPGRAPLPVHYNSVGGNYFAILGTRILAGRGIAPDDRAGAPPVVVASRNLVHQLFENRDPLGKWISINGTQRQIVGVAEDAPSVQVHEDPEPFLYFPHAQMPSGDVMLIVAAAGDPAALTQTVRRELRNFDNLAVVYAAQTFSEYMDGALLLDRITANISTVLGIFGMLLAAAGMFGVLQHGVVRRTRELGVRMALGASTAGIQGLVFRESLLIGALGALVGMLMLAGLHAALRAVTSGLALSPLVYFFSAAAALAIAIVSGWLPARRATRINVVEAIRYE